MHSIGKLTLTSAILVVFTSLYSSVANCAEDEFPGRKRFPSIKVITIDELYKQRENVAIVDVRSEYEFNTLRIKDAKHIPLSSLDFIKQVKSLRETDPRPIVFYCNGKTCMKSYKAVRKCKVFSVGDVLAYDAGVMDWARTYPDQAVLLGKSPIDPKQLLSGQKFKQHLLAPAKFEEMAERSNVIILDVRDRFQKETLSIYHGKERSVFLDNKPLLDKYIDQAKDEGKTLLVYDAAGKQVRWLQYYLESRQLQDYYFMRGGVSEYDKYVRKKFFSSN